MIIFQEGQKWIFLWGMQNIFLGGRGEKVMKFYFGKKLIGKRQIAKPRYPLLSLSDAHGYSIRDLG